jgi:hypothetical protein
MMTESLPHFSGGCTIFKRKGKCYRLGAVIICLLLAPWASATEEDSLPVIHFSIKPRLCVLTDGEEVCRDELEVRWSSEQARSLCLYQDGQPMPLQCWANEKNGHYQFTLTASASTNFQLRADDSQQAVGREMFEVVYQQKKYRKQRRNPWSFF